MGGNGVNAIDFMKLLIIIYAAVNLLVFIVYGVDKYKAIHNKWRIPEATLLVAALFGVIGALLGMIFFRHKTRKLKFLIIVPLIFTIEAVLAGYFFFRTMVAA